MSEKTLAEQINSLHAIFDNYVQHHEGVTIGGTVPKKALKGAIFTIMSGTKIRNFFVEEVGGNRSNPHLAVRFGELEMVIPLGATSAAKTLPYVAKMTQVSVVVANTLCGDLYRYLTVIADDSPHAYLVASLKFDYSHLTDGTVGAKRYNYKHHPKPVGEL